MTEEQIEQKAKNVYTRCFDDDFKYSGVLHALEICVEETATEATKELQEEMFTTEGRLSLALLSQWLHGGESNINIVSDTQRFLKVKE